MEDWEEIEARGQRVNNDIVNVNGREIIRFLDNAGGGGAGNIFIGEPRNPFGDNRNQPNNRAAHDWSQDE